MPCRLFKPSASGGSSSTNNLYQIKTLSADVTSTTADIASLKFNNLTIGKIYRLSVQAFINVQGSTHRGILQILNNSVTVGYITFAAPAYTGTGPIACYGNSFIFEAAATTVVFSFTDTGGNASLLGNNTTAETYATLEELNNYTVTTGF